jgi:hypothetical protein
MSDRPKSKVELWMPAIVVLVAELARHFLDWLL